MPLRSERLAQGLVIDDFFSISIEPINSSDVSQAQKCYDRAQEAYTSCGLLGSPHKDIVDSSEGRVIGAYLNGSKRATDLGLVTVSAPPQKRLSMAYITLKLCQLRRTTDSLHLCLVGGWVSILGFRRPLISLLQDTFKVVNVGQYDKDDPKILSLSRKVADELTVLSTLIPLMCSELSAPYLGKIFCSDASNSKGAVLEAEAPVELVEVLWKACKTKGAYTRLLSPVESILRRLDAFEETNDMKDEAVPERPLAFSFEFIEVFAGAAKISDCLLSLGIQVGPALDIGESPEYNMKMVHMIEWLTHLVRERRLLAFFLGPPCTTFSIMRRPRLRDPTQPYGYRPIGEQAMTGNTLALRSLQLMHVGAQCDSSGIVETPYSSYMKRLPPWQVLKKKEVCSEARVDSCRFGSPHLKSFRFLGLRVCLESLALKYQCTHRHVVVQGSLTKDSATYTDALARQIAQVLYDSILASRSRIYEASDVQVKGLESQLVNDAMLSAKWRVKKCWTFKGQSHINILEEASLLRLCQSVVKEHTSVRVVGMVDSNVVRCATSKGRTSSLGLSPILRRVAATCVAGGLYLCAPFCPTRLNCSDDPTRDVPLRGPISGLRVAEWDRESLFKLARLTKTKRWASNWIRMVLLLLGPDVLELSDRSQFREGNLVSSLWVSDLEFSPHDDFDSALGYPGEGPTHLPMCHVKRKQTSDNSLESRPCRWNLNTGLPGLFRSRHSCVCLGLFFALLRPSLFVLCCASVGVAGAMPIRASTAGEVRKAEQRGCCEPLHVGRPVTTTTNIQRDRFWNAFQLWTNEVGVDLESLLENSHLHVEELNYLLTKYGRELYKAGKSYNQYAETINALGARRPAIRRMLQQAWDLGYSWVKSEPSIHHTAMPVPIILALISTALWWGWVRVAGCLALGFNGLLRPGELTGAFRRDLLLPSDVGFSACFALLSIREPKSRFTYARHQTAKADCPDLLKVIELAFSSLRDGEKLWPFSPQTLRNRLRSLLQALHLPLDDRNGARCLDLGSLRSGGATFIINMTENSELCRRRGRWASMKMMDIYIQETMALQYMKVISPEAKTLVLSAAGAFLDTVEKATSLSRSNIPLNTWYILFTRWKKLEVQNGREDGWMSFGCVLQHWNFGQTWPSLLSSSPTSSQLPSGRNHVDRPHTMDGKEALCLIGWHYPWDALQTFHFKLCPPAISQPISGWMSFGCILQRWNFGQTWPSLLSSSPTSSQLPSGRNHVDRPHTMDGKEALCLIGWHYPWDALQTFHFKLCPPAISQPISGWMSFGCILQRWNFGQTWPSLLSSSPTSSQLPSGRNHVDRPHTMDGKEALCLIGYLYIYIYIDIDIVQRKRSQQMNEQTNEWTNEWINQSINQSSNQCI